MTSSVHAPADTAEEGPRHDLWPGCEDGASVFLIDDDAAVAASIAALLAGYGVACATFPGVEAFLAAVGPDASGCLLLDYRMPEIDGLRALPMLARQCPLLSIVMITAHGDVDVAVRAMKAGAVDFVEKPWARDAFIERVRAALADAKRKKAMVCACADARARLAALTPREREVLDELVTGAPNKIIAHRLGLSTRTVEFHRARVLDKAGVRSVAELVRLKTCADGA